MIDSRSSPHRTFQHSRRRLLGAAAASTAIGIIGAPSIATGQTAPRFRIGYWVAEILPYADPRPRTVETLPKAGFIGAKKRSLEVFQREVRR